MTTPNGVLRAVRMGMRMSQDDFARAIREAGQRAGIDLDAASKRLVQRWESGLIVSPRPVYARALEAVTGLPLESLGFAMPVPHAQLGNGDGDGDGAATPAETFTSPGTPPRAQATPQGNYAGVWLSRYEYYSSGRGQSFTGLHHVLVLQHGTRLTVRSLPGSSESTLTMDLTVDGAVITGTWVEQTSDASYYRGARYHGAIQMLAEPTGRRMSGQWVGFGRNMDVNTGPWELVFMDASTNKATMDAYNRPPD